MATRSRSRDTAVSSNHAGVRKRPSKSMRQQTPKPEESVDDSAWIHRDKLAAIEIQEMEDAGMHVRQPYRSDSIGHGGRTTRSSSRSMSRNGVRKAQSKDLLNEEAQYAADREDYDKKRVSTIHAADEEEDYYDREYSRRYQAEDRMANEPITLDYGSRGHISRPSTSRIPVSKTNAAAAAAAAASSNGLGEDGIPRTWDDLKRMRSGSAGSAVLLDDFTPERDQTTSKSKQPANATSRKRQDRSTSAQRSPSSSATKRPTTSHAKPEGEAPWIATMYKPDPRLPPEEQMLPTHAKRMMQKQWEREGKFGQTYDKDLRLLDDDEIQQPPPPQSTQEITKAVASPSVSDGKENVPPTPSPAAKEAAEEWPLTPGPDGKRLGATSPQPSVNGGYRITPAITSNSPAPRTPRASMGPVEVPAIEKPQSQPTRVPDYDEKDERAAKKGCCCVMM